MCEINDRVGLISPSHPNSEIGEQVSDEELDTNWTEGEGNFRRSSLEHPEVAESKASEPQSSDFESTNSELQEMGDANNNDNANANNQPWLLQDALEIPGRQHCLLRHQKKLLPKFNPDSKEPVEDHIQKFMLANHLMSVQAEDVVCRLFPYTFEGKAST